MPLASGILCCSLALAGDMMTPGQNKGEPV
jgi:hypothetical protein